MMGLFVKTLPLILTVVLSLQPAAAALSVPDRASDYATSARVQAIAATATQIANGPRTFPIAGVEYPFYYGPTPTPGSLTAATQLQELQKLMTFRTNYPTYMASLAVNNSAQLTSMAAVADLYHQASAVVEKPMSMDNSDVAFGEQRLSIKSFALREATAADLDGRALSLSLWQLGTICGLGVTQFSLRLSHALFVENYRDLAQFNDPRRPDKYVPNVVGFFCINLYTRQLLPVEIRVLDTKLTYTPYDTQDDWTLAKMALETASVSYHQMQHMAETHAVTIPLRVEAMRTMSVEHPVRTLLQRHVFADFGLEMQVAVLLLNTSTLLDKTFGWGATGATRFLYAQTEKGLSVKRQSFYVDVRERGLDNIPNHKYVTYGNLYWTAIRTFVDRYLTAFYAADRDVVADVELQQWAASAGATIPHVRDFPTAFQSKGQVRELMTHLIFTCTVRHHGMNGAATWHGMSVPFAPAALWKPLPTTKRQAINLLEYTVPTTVLPSALALGAMFLRPVPPSESMFGAYRAEPFASEPKLASAIDAFDAALKEIEATIAQREASSKWPYHLLRPTRMPYYTWV